MGTHRFRSPQFRAEHLGLGTSMQDGGSRPLLILHKYKKPPDFSGGLIGSPKGNRTPVPSVRDFENNKNDNFEQEQTKINTFKHNNLGYL